MINFMDVLKFLKTVNSTIKNGLIAEKGVHVKKGLIVTDGINTEDGLVVTSGDVKFHDIAMVPPEVKSLLEPGTLFIEFQGGDEAPLMIKLPLSTGLEQLPFIPLKLFRLP